MDFIYAILIPSSTLPSIPFMSALVSKIKLNELLGMKESFFCLLSKQKPKADDARVVENISFLIPFSKPSILIKFPKFSSY